MIIILIFLINLINCENLDDVIDQTIIIYNLVSKVHDKMFSKDFNLSRDVCEPILYKIGCNEQLDSEGYYIDLDDCINHFTNVYRRASLDEVYFRGNTSTCRIYIFLTFFDSQFCKIYGKTGGDQCVDHDYKSYFSEEY